MQLNAPKTIEHINNESEVLYLLSTFFLMKRNLKETIFLEVLNFSNWFEIILEVQRTRTISWVN